MRYKNKVWAAVSVLILAINSTCYGITQHKFTERTIDLTDGQVAGEAVDRRHWQVVFTDIEEIGHEAEKAFDGDLDTIWHTIWSAHEMPPPHELVIDLGGHYEIVGFRILTTFNREGKGNIKEYQFDVAETLDGFGEPAAKGILKTDMRQEKVTVLFKPRRGRYVRLIALSEIQGRPWTSICEFDVLKKKGSDVRKLSEAEKKSAQSYVPHGKKTLAASTDEPVEVDNPKHPWPLGEGPFKPDRHTTLLAHLDKPDHKADFAMGKLALQGMGYLYGPGYYGDGIDLEYGKFRSNHYRESKRVLPFCHSFGVDSRQNFNPYQGTLEFWFKLENDQPLEVKAGLGRLVGSVTVSPRGFRVLWPTVAKGLVNGDGVFPEPLAKDKWHYYTQTWGDGEFVLYIDGRKVFTQDIRGKLGVVANTFMLYLGFWNAHGKNPPPHVRLDEIALSKVIRYTNAFEPRWRGGKRPTHAFRGMGNQVVMRRGPTNEKEPVIGKIYPLEPSGQGFFELKLANGEVLSFDRRDGFVKKAEKSGRTMKDIREGLLIFGGHDRRKIFDKPVVDDLETEKGEISFTQKNDSFQVAHKIEKQGEATIWEVDVKNLGEKEQAIELLFSIPCVAAKIESYFDGQETHRAILDLPRRREGIHRTLPYVGVVTPDGYTGIGLDPHIWVNVLIHEFVPTVDGAVIREGTKVVIDGGDTLKFRYVITSGPAPYGWKNCLAGYYERFPELFSIRENIPALAKMPLCCSMLSGNPKARLIYMNEKARQVYVGHNWNPHPSTGIKGDPLGRKKYFNNPKYFNEPTYRPAKKKMDRLYKGSQDIFKENQIKEFQYPRLNYYTARACHMQPIYPHYIICKDLYPEGIDDDGDRLAQGQKFMHMGIYAINGYNTPIGENSKLVADELNKVWGKNNVGFILDTGYCGAHQLNDPIAQKTRYRGFSRHRGEFVVFGWSHADLYKHIKNLKYQGTDLNLLCVTDGGCATYMQATVADKIAHERNTLWLRAPVNFEGISSSRIMAGEKQMPFLGGRLRKGFKPAPFDPDYFRNVSEKDLRQFYRHFYDHLLLKAFENGEMIGAGAAAFGQQKIFNHRTLHVECDLSGYKIVPDAKTTDRELFISRYGEVLNTKLVVGNRASKERQTDILVDRRLSNGKVLLFGDYYGEKVAVRFEPDVSVYRDLKIKKRNIRALRAWALLDSDIPEKATVSLQNNGPQFVLSIDYTSDKAGKLNVMPYVPEDYAIRKVVFNGEMINKEEILLNSKKGQNKLSIEYGNTIFRTSPARWEKVQLIKNNEVKFRTVTSGNATKMDKGTAEWPNNFVMVYDFEDGVPGNLKAKGEAWEIVLSAGKAPVVLLNPERKVIRIEGPNDLERRRAMAVFMRFVDRKYPHIGGFLGPSKLSWDHYRYVDKGSIGRMMVKKMKEFQFDKKPILTEEYEYLYENDSIDFQGKYGLKFPPYVYEPARWD